MTDSRVTKIPDATGISRMTLWGAILIIISSLSVVAQSIEAYIDYSAENLPGRLYVPPEGQDPTALRPMIIALHGGGAIGDNNVGNIWDFEPLLEVAQSAGAFLYAPQSTSAFWHRDGRPAAIMAQIDRAIERYGIDPNRISLTGFSMGGGGTWHLGSIYSDRFSAIMPICGIAPGDNYVAAALLEKPTWVFHARNDSSVSVDSSRNRLDELLQIADLPKLQPPARSSVSDYHFTNESLSLRYTEFGTGGHAIWDRAYSSVEAMHWLMNQTLLGPTIEPEPTPVITTHPQSTTLIAGSSLTLTVETSGIDAPTFQWIHDDIPITGATEQTYHQDNLHSTNGGSYRVKVSGPDDALTSRPAIVRVAKPILGQITNLSVRTHLDNAAGPLIAGFVSTGPAHERLLRAIGPALTEHGISDPMPNPRVQVHASINGADTIETSNQDWQGNPRVRQLSAETGAFPITDTASHDAALTWSGTGVFTAHVSDETGQSGTVLVELYGNDIHAESPLINVSARQNLPSSENTLVVGFVLDGNAPRQLLVRAIGPGLARAGVDDPMPNPQLSVFLHQAGEATLFAENTRWITEANADQISTAVPGAFPIDEKENDAAVLLNFPAGVYTVHASSADQQGGDVLVETYFVQ